MTSIWSIVWKDGWGILPFVINVLLNYDWLKEQINFVFHLLRHKVYVQDAADSHWPTLMSH